MCFINRSVSRGAFLQLVNGTEINTPVHFLSISRHQGVLFVQYTRQKPHHLTHIQATHIAVIGVIRSGLVNSTIYNVQPWYFFNYRWTRMIDFFTFGELLVEVILFRRRCVAKYHRRRMRNRNVIYIPQRAIASEPFDVVEMSLHLRCLLADEQAPLCKERRWFDAFSLSPSTSISLFHRSTDMSLGDDMGNGIRKLSKWIWWIVLRSGSNDFFDLM